MDEKLENWLDELVERRTFETRDDAIEFCIGATRAFCESLKLDRKALRKIIENAREYGEDLKGILSVPLKWSDELDNWLRKQVKPWQRL